MRFSFHIPWHPLIFSRKTATSIDFAKKQVILEDGKDSIVYDKLILAPGGAPRKLPIPGAELENVYTVRGVDSTKKVDAGRSLRRNYFSLVDVLFSFQRRRKERK